MSGDVTKLPKWAQAHILGLERRIERRDQTIAALRQEHSEDTNTFADNYLDRIPLPRGQRIEFHLHDDHHDYIACQVKVSDRGDRWLEIAGSWAGVVVTPRASNVIEVRHK